ncbi:MAG: cytidylate kinase-like family protein [Bacteroidales bacterium]|nr:cytidylate kinase-like family protein [Bacteroidales bacterium]
MKDSSNQQSKTSEEQPAGGLVITIGRQFGSGGREVGRKLAEALGFDYYDKELLAEAAKRAGVAPEFFERNDERAPTFFNGLFSFAQGLSAVNFYSGSTSISDDSLYRVQSDFIHSLAQKGRCVIVGRSSDYVLRDYPRLLNIFVHATVDDCCRRIMEREPGMTHDKARSRAEKVNRLRANYYNFYTDKTWGAASSYDLTLNTSLLSLDSIVEVVKTYIRERFGSLD